MKENLKIILSILEIILGFVTLFFSNNLSIVFSVEKRIIVSISLIVLLLGVYKVVPIKEEKIFWGLIILLITYAIGLI